MAREERNRRWRGGVQGGAELEVRRCPRRSSTGDKEVSGEELDQWRGGHERQGGGHRGGARPNARRRAPGEAEVTNSPDRRGQQFDPRQGANPNADAWA
jgi:hypothetical protein